MLNSCVRNSADCVGFWCRLDISLSDSPLLSWFGIDRSRVLYLLEMDPLSGLGWTPPGGFVPHSLQRLGNCAAVYNSLIPQPEFCPGRFREDRTGTPKAQPSQLASRNLVQLRAHIKDEATPFPCDQWQVLIGKNRQVCRNLFGPVDRQQLRSELRDEIGNSLEAARIRWAFDFKEERPVPGDLQWEAVPSQDVPSFYRPVCCMRQRPLLNPQETADGTEERSLSSKQSTSPLFNRKRKQALITDFYALKRKFGPLGPESKP